MKEVFPPNTFIETIDVSLLSKSKAVEKLSSIPVDDVFASALVIYGEEVGDFKFKPSSLGAFVKPLDSVNRAFEAAHKQGYIKSLSDRLSKQKEPFPVTLAVDEGLLKGTLTDLAEEVLTSSRDATKTSPVKNRITPVACNGKRSDCLAPYYVFV
ncbi:MAG: peptidoglycan binding domain-containing protein [Candidatus Saganbacteria bacterium]|nr:peptidoglycan binding domain-containing protein [Candidatus Saganbacteria bacterium]